MGGSEEKPGCALGVDVHELAEADGHLPLHLLETKTLIRKESSGVAKCKALLPICSSERRYMT